MSTPPAAAVRKGPNWIVTSVGALIVLAIVILVNVFAGMSNSRFDMTENKVHTLTQGTKNILSRVDTNTTIKFFISPKEVLPPQLQPFVDQTDSWLARIREVNPDKVTVEKIEVEPATDEQEQAAAAKIEARQGMFYFGISVSCLENTANIDWVPDALSSDGKEDDRIEYSLAKAISEVTRTKKKKIGLMSALPLEGGMGGPEWSVVKELKAQYEIKKIEVTASSIEDGIDVLLLIHPAGITDEAQFAVDQYLLKGGRVVAFLDANSLMAQASKQNQNPMMAQMGQGGVEVSSNIPKLLAKWGYTFDTTKIVADPQYGMPLNGNLVQPVLLQMGEEAIGDKTDELTKDLKAFFSVYSGAFSGSPAADLTETVFLKTSDKHAMVGMEYASANPTGPEAIKQAQQLAVKIKPEGKARLLSLRLAGKFKTAFPEGKPAPPPPKPPGGPPGGGFPGGGFPGGGFPGGPQGAQGPEGAPADPAATPATPAAVPAAPPVAEPAPPVAVPAAPPAAVPAAPPAAAPAAPPAAAPATPAEAPVTATTPPISITPGTPATPETPAIPGAPAPIPVTPAPATDSLLPPAAGTTPPADAPSFLKESAEGKDGIVYLLGDSDMIADIQPNFQSHNFALALGMIDQASGDRDLLEVRGRGAATRPFSTLKKIMQEANDKIQKDVESMQAEAEKLATDVNSQRSAKDRNNALLKGWKEMQAKETTLRKQIYQKQKEAKKEYESMIFGIKWRNVFLPPLLVALAGIAVFITRKVRTAAH